MAKPPPISDDERRRVRTLHAAGLPRNAIAKEIKRSGSTVSKIAQELGLSFNREAVKAATEARVADAKARRAELMHGLLEDAERLRDQLFAPTIVFNIGGKDNVYTEHPVEQPPTRDQRDLVHAVSTAITASLRIDEHDGDGGADDAKGMVGMLYAGLKVAAEQLHHEQAPDDPGGD